jgi:hypothetical protein
LKVGALERLLGLPAAADRVFFAWFAQQPLY